MLKQHIKICCHFLRLLLLLSAVQIPLPVHLANPNHRITHVIGRDSLVYETHGSIVSYRSSCFSGIIPLSK